MNGDQDMVIAWRLRSQLLDGPRAGRPEEVVRRLGAVQAQDDRWGRWSIGLRAHGCTATDVEEAVSERRIIRTWLLRGTLHFVATPDVGWMTAMVGQRIISGNARRYRELGLDDTAFSRSAKVLRRALEREGSLTRTEIKARFMATGVPAEGQQLAHLLQRAALDGVICFGLPRGNKPAYVLLSEWAGVQEAADPEEGSRQLARRYVESHGPATVDDFAWWGGLSKSQARAALGSASGVMPMRVDDTDYWVQGDRPAAGAEPAAHLLSPFDNYLLGYKDRSLVLDPRHAKQVNAGGGMLRPTVIADGRVVGTWNRQLKKHAINVSIEPFRELAAAEGELVERAAARLAGFHALPVRLDMARDPIS